MRPNPVQYGAQRRVFVEPVARTNIGGGKGAQDITIRNPRKLLGQDIRVKVKYIITDTRAAGEKRVDENFSRTVRRVSSRPARAAVWRVLGRWPWSTCARPIAHRLAAAMR